VTTRFPIRFDSWYAVLSSALFLRPSDSYVSVTATDVTVRMGWAFHATFARSAVASVEQPSSPPISRGVHGFAGRWLVNGSGHGVLALNLVPSQRGRVLGVPVRLDQLMVSVDDPAALASALGHRD
jgi:hypothetical protein